MGQERGWPPFRAWSQSSPGLGVREPLVCHWWPLLISQPLLASTSLQRWVGRASLGSSSLHQAPPSALEMLREQLQGGPWLGLGVVQEKVLGQWHRPPCFPVPFPVPFLLSHPGPHRAIDPSCASLLHCQWLPVYSLPPRHSQLMKQNQEKEAQPQPLPLTRCKRTPFSLFLLTHHPTLISCLQPSSALTLLLHSRNAFFPRSSATTCHQASPLCGSTAATPPPLPGFPPATSGVAITASSREGNSSA